MLKRIFHVLVVSVMFLNQAWAGITFNPFTGKLDFTGGSSGAANPFSGGGGGTNTSGSFIYCNTGTASVSSATGQWTVNGTTVAAIAGLSQDLEIITGTNGNLRLDHVILTEHTQFSGTSITSVKLSMGSGTSGVAGSTDDVFLVQTAFGNSSGDQYLVYDRPSPNLIGSSNTFSVVVGVRTVGANITALNGAFNYEVCGYNAQ